MLEFLSRKFAYLSEKDWKICLEEKRVEINGVPAVSEDILNTDDRLETFFPNIEEPPVRKDYRIVHEDPALIAVDKPGGLPCHPGGIYFENTLWRLLQKRFDRSQLHFVHRLDRETSGIVLIARSQVAAKKIQAEFLAGRVKKRYLALVDGAFPKQTVRAKGWLARDPASAVRKKLLFLPEDEGGGMERPGKWCETVFRGLSTGRGVSLVEASPATGRLHQIRATLLAMGHPVVGDKLYGTDETIFLRFIRDEITDADNEALRLDRQALHSYEMVFRHPESKERIALKAALPQGWQTLSNLIPSLGEYSLLSAIPPGLVKKPGMLPSPRPRRCICT